MRLAAKNAASLKKPAVTMGQGFCMGTADVIPGVSGGTMAFILGIYQQLLQAIRAFDGQFLRYCLQRDFRAAFQHVELSFLLPLGIGIFTALMFFTRVVSLPTLIREHPEMIYSLFFGLVLASIGLLLKLVGRVSLVDGAFFLFGAALGYIIVNLVPMETPNASWFLTLSGAVAICAMLLPGISGAFILLILRKYAYVLDAIGRLDLTVILPFAMGAVIGLMLFSRALVWLLHHYHRRTILVITGLLTGSLWVIWPFQTRTYAVIHGKSRLVDTTPVMPVDLDGELAAAAALMLVGIGLVVWLHTLAGKRVYTS